jgi:protein required for attachment to host cells
MAEKNNILLVADSSKAKIYKVKNFRVESLVEDIKASDTIKIHKQPRVKDNFYQKASLQSHFFDPRSQIKQINRKNFSKEISHSLLRLYKEKPFNSLFIIAEPKILGDLRQELDPVLLNVICKEEAKDVSNLTKEQIEKHLQ